MYEIAMFVEDYAHRIIIGALVRRLARQDGVEVNLDWHTSSRGYGRVVRMLKEYSRMVDRPGGALPDLVVVATDANCKGLNQRLRDLAQPYSYPPTVYAVPDPHVERWLLLDGAAFRAVLGRGCDAPDYKCSCDRYKRLSSTAVRIAVGTPEVSGLEFADEIVAAMDIDRAARGDESFKRFVGGLSAEFRRWQK